MPPDDASLLTLTARIVSAHCASNMVPVDALPGLIHRVHAALAAPEPVDKPAALTAPTPAVPIRRSVFPDHIVCLEDGKKLKMLKRHLRSAFGMTPDQYRERWGLPPSYPMVAPDYAQKRSLVARQIGLGRRGEEAAPDEASADVPEVQHLPERGRRRKRM